MGGNNLKYIKKGTDSHPVSAVFSSPPSRAGDLLCTGNLNILAKATSKCGPGRFFPFLMYPKYNLFPPSLRQVYKDNFFLASRVGFPR